MDIKQMAKMAGVSDEELIGRSPKEQIKIISKAMKEAAEQIELEAAKELINNSKKVQKVIDLLENPLTILANNVGKKKSASQVQVIGYISSSKEIVVLNGSKAVKIKEADVVKTENDLISKPKEKTSEKKATPKKSGSSKNK